MDEDIKSALLNRGWEPHCPRRRFPIAMPTPREFRKNAEDCLKLARETNKIYAKLALIEMATEFRVMAEHLERDAQRIIGHRRKLIGRPDRKKAG